MNQNHFNHDTSNPAPEAVEVACLLGDSVVQVSHLEHTDRAPSRRSSLMVMLAGAAFLAISVAAFARGVAVAAADKVALQQWTEVYDLPASEFRGESMSLAWDYMAFGGLGLGIMALAFGLFRLRARRAKSQLVVGRGAEVDVAADIGVEAMPMVRTSPAGSVVAVAPGMTAELLAGSTAVALPELVADGRARPSLAVAGGYDIDLTRDVSVRLGAGPAGFFVRPSSSAETRLGAFAAGIDRRAGMFFAGSALAHLAMLLVLAWVPPTTRSLALDTGSSRSRISHVESFASEDAIDEATDATGANADEVEANGASSAAAGAHGLEGNDSDREAGKTQIAARAANPQMSRAQVIAMAQESGVLGSVSADYFRHALGSADFSSGDADIDTWGHNGRDGNSAGDFGWSRSRGPGPGAGGNSDTISTDESEYYRQGPTNDGGDIGPGPRKPKGPVLKFPSPTEAWGDLDKDIIRRYIKRKSDQLRYAYEKALLVDGELAGTVTVTFIINGQGLVIEARATGMGPDSMRKQVEDIFQSIKFPRPSGNGIVRVVYPINFNRPG